MNAAWLLLATAAALWTGACAVRALWPGGRGAMLVILKGLLALAIGWAVMAAHHVLWRAVYGEFELAYRLLDCVAIPALAWWGMRRLTRRGEGTGGPPVPRASRPALARVGMGLLLAATLVAVAGAVLVTAGNVFREPIGQWDGWAIWNLKARFLFRGGDEWRGMLRREIWFSHPDYPLLLPASIARLWTYLGHETTLVPQLTAVGYTALVMALLFASLSWLRGTAQACAGVLLLAGSETFLHIGGAQYADVPLSLYMLGSLAALAAAQRVERGQNGLLVLAGIVAGCGAMLKNEGLVIVLALLGGTLLAGRWAGQGRRWTVVLLLAGMLPGLLALAGQKVFLAGESYLTADQPSRAAVTQKVMDGSRYRMIAAEWLDWNFGLQPHRPVDRWNFTIPLPARPEVALLLATAILWRIRPDPRDRFTLAAGLAAIALLALAYAAVFLVMPYDLKGLLDSTLSRLQLHFWPSLIFVVLLGCGGRDHGLAEDGRGDLAA